jgi:hypothetical protein
VIFVFHLRLGRKADIQFDQAASNPHDTAGGFTGTLRVSADRALPQQILPLVDAFDDDGRSHAAAGTHGNQASTQIAALKLIQHRAN